MSIYTCFALFFPTVFYWFCGIYVIGVFVHHLPQVLMPDPLLMRRVSGRRIEVTGDASFNVVKI